jgi:predicted nucleic acid-binding protein
VNVVLDFVLDRPPFGEAASALWASAERKQIEAVVPAHGVTTVFYLAARQRDSAFARRVVSDLLAVPDVAAVDGAVLRRALALAWPDFEDAVCAAAAEGAGCDTLVTRDPKGYRGSSVVIMDPPTAVSLLRRGPGPDEVAERSGLPDRTDRGRKPGRPRREPRR